MIRTLILLTLFFTGAAQADTYSDMGVEQPDTPLAAPAFELTDLSGTKVSLDSLSGKVVLLNFWATWCPPCREEMPGMEQLWQKYSDRGLVIVAITVDDTDERGIRKFVEQLGLTYPVLIDTGSSVADRYAVGGLPTSFLIDRDGQVLGSLLGGRDWTSPEANRLIESLLGETITLR